MLKINLIQNCLQKRIMFWIKIEGWMQYISLLKFFKIPTSFDPHATTGYGTINMIEGFGFGNHSPAVSFTAGKLIKSMSDYCYYNIRWK